VTPESRRDETVIAGGGMAGIVAASIRATAGVPVLLIDENEHLGGQYLRSPSPSLGPSLGREHERERRLGLELAAELAGHKVLLLNNSRILGIYPDRELLVETDGQRTMAVHAQFLLLAPGARERFLPFPGWTLPGVLSAGALQTLLKGQGILPAESIVLAGSGLFLLAAAAETVRAGGKVTAVLEATPFARKLGLLRPLLALPGKSAEGLGLLATLLAHRVPLRHRTVVVRAEGEGRLERIVTARLDDHGKPIATSEQTHPCECLALGGGFVPNIELAQLAGIEPVFNPRRGGWVVPVADSQETKVDHVYAAGEITGIGGAAKARIEGEIAARAILRAMGLGQSDEEDRLRARLRRRQQRQVAFADRFNTRFVFPAALWQDIPDETLLCRCEDVSMSEVRQALAAGYTSLQSLKTVVRVGMGECQGRTCGPILQEVFAAIAPEGAPPLPPPTVRPPVKPAALESLANFF